MSNMEQRLGPGMLYEGPSLEPGIVRTYPDGVMWLIKPDGTRCVIPCAGGGGGGAPVDAEYVVMALNATLTNERVLTPGDALALTDGGAGGNAVLDVLVDGVTIQVNGLNQLETVSAGPSGPAGGVLDGTYPNPGLAASVAGDGLSEVLNVLNVNVGDALAIVADIIDVQVDGVTIQVNGGNQLEVIGAPPSGAAGGVLDGTYPNPGLAASVAGDGLSEVLNVLNVNVGDGLAITADVIDVLVDGSSIGFNGSNQLEVIGGALTNAVIKNPLTNTRNQITGTGNVINLPIVGEVGQTAHLFTVSDATMPPFFRLFADRTIGVGAGTFTPATYEGFSSLYVFSRNPLVAGGGPAITPGAGVTSIPMRLDTEVSPTANTGAVQNFHTKVVYDTAFTSPAVSATYTESSFRGTKAAGSGNQLTVSGLLGISVLTDQATASTGDLVRVIGVQSDVRLRGTGTVGPAGVDGILSMITLSNNNPPVPIVRGFRTQVLFGAAGAALTEAIGVAIEMTSTGRAVTLLEGVSVGPLGGTGVVESRGVNIANQVGATTPYAIYSAGGQSRLHAGTATVVPLTLKGAAAQSGHLFDTRDSADALIVALTAAGVFEFGSAADTNLYRGAANQLKTDDDLAVGANWIVSASGFINGVEIATPATPAANNGRLYFRDSGGGITQLIALWPSGNTTVIAEDF